MTMSSRNTTISCVQYCSRHGLLVNTADGSAVRNSSVIQSGIAGLQSTCTTEKLSHNKLEFNGHSVNVDFLILLSP